jgi:hypothetical protein
MMKQTGNGAEVDQDLTLSKFIALAHWEQSLARREHSVSRERPNFGSQNQEAVWI